MRIEGMNMKRGTFKLNEADCKKRFVLHKVKKRWVVTGIIYVLKHGLQCKDAPKEYGPAKTLYNRWKRWSDNGVFARIMVGLAAERAEHKTIMIDATYLKAHRTASSLRVKKGGVLARSGARKAA